LKTVCSSSEQLLVSQLKYGEWYDTAVAKAHNEADFLVGIGETETLLSALMGESGAILIFCGPPRKQAQYQS
jgi:hypothetical protein